MHTIRVWSLVWRHLRLKAGYPSFQRLSQHMCVHYITKYSPHLGNFTIRAWSLVWRQLRLNTGCHNIYTHTYIHIIYHITKKQCVRREVHNSRVEPSVTSPQTKSVTPPLRDCHKHIYNIYIHSTPSACTWCIVQSISTTPDTSPAEGLALGELGRTEAGLNKSGEKKIVAGNFHIFFRLYESLGMVFPQIFFQNWKIPSISRGEIFSPQTWLSLGQLCPTEAGWNQ